MTAQMELYKKTMKECGKEMGRKKTSQLRKRWTETRKL